MQDVIIADTSCLILLDNIGELELLKQLYQRITVTPEIAEEFEKKLPNWISIASPSNKTYQQILEVSIDRGEASAIALALEHKNCILIIDDLKGRKFAEQVGITITGTLGIITKAKQVGKINSVKPYLDKIQNTNFRISNELIKIILKNSGEA